MNMEPENLKQLWEKRVGIQSNTNTFISKHKIYRNLATLLQTFMLFPRQKYKEESHLTSIPTHPQNYSITNVRPSHTYI